MTIVIAIVGAIITALLALVWYSLAFVGATPYDSVVSH